MSAGNVELGTARRMAGKPSSRASEFDNYQILMWAILGGLVTAIVLCYGNTLMVVSRAWDSPKYSHGYLVPVFTAVLLWLRYEPFKKPTPSAQWAGVGVIAAGMIGRLILTYMSSKVPEMYTMVPCIVGAFLIVGGWPTLRWAGPAVLFLVFMFPLPGPLDGGLLAPVSYTHLTLPTILRV